MHCSGQRASHSIEKPPEKIRPSRPDITTAISNVMEIWETSELLIHGVLFRAGGRKELRRSRPITDRGETPWVRTAATPSQRMLRAGITTPARIVQILQLWRTHVREQGHAQTWRQGPPRTVGPACSTTLGVAAPVLLLAARDRTQLRVVSVGLGRIGLGHSDRGEQVCRNNLHAVVV